MLSPSCASADAHEGPRVLTAPEKTREQAAARWRFDDYRRLVGVDVGGRRAGSWRVAARRVAAAAVVRFAGVAAINPGAFEALVVGGFEGAAAGATGPAADLVGGAAFVAAAFPVAGPRFVSGDGLAAFGVPGKGNAAAIALHAHGNSGEGGGAELRRAERVTVAVADARQEVLPQGLRAVPFGDAAAVPAD